MQTNTEKINIFLKIICIYKHFTIENILGENGVYNSKSKRKKEKKGSTFVWKRVSGLVPLFYGQSKY